MTFGASAFGSTPFGAAGGTAPGALLGSGTPAALTLILSAWISAQVPTPLALALTAQQPHGAPVLGLALAAYQSAHPTLPMQLTALPAQAYAAHTRWRPVVRLGGQDVSAQLVGQIAVDAEEDAARIAEFAFVPPAGPVSPMQWVGAAVEIAFALADSGGAALYPLRIFSGIVDVPEFDPVSGRVSMRATDNLQELMSAAARSQIAALIGGHWSAAVFEADSDNWRYAQDRLSTVPASLDLDPYRSARVSSWQAKGSADITVTDPIDQSLRCQWANRAQMKNRIDIGFTYRLPRCKRRVIGAGYRYPFSLDQVLIHGYSMPTRDMIEQAVAGTGWQVVTSIRHIDVPPGPITVNLGNGIGVWSVSPDVAAALSWGFSTRLARRYVQWVEERYTLSVANAASEAALGTIRGAEAAQLAVAFDAGAWERDAGAAPQLSALSIGEASADPATAGHDDRAAAQAAIATLVARAQRSIWATHRLNAAGCTVPFNAAADLDRTVRIAAGGITAQGKCRRLRHSMDLASGAATTEIEIALGATTAVGLPPHDDPVAPAAPAVPALPADAELACATSTWVGSSLQSAPLRDDMHGFFTNVAALSSLYSAAAPAYEPGFVLEVPQIDDVSRDNLVVELTQHYAARVVEDPFTVST
jgi:hypothetical protein